MRLAWRNLFRNVRRSLITTSAIAVGVGALIFVWGYVDGINEQMIENTTRYLSGHLQVHQQGFHQEKTLDLFLPEPPRVAAALAGFREVQAFSPRLEGQALASSAERSTGLRVMGIDPAAESRVTSLHRAVVEGRFLVGKEAGEVVLGRKVAESLRVGVGDDVVFLTQGADGSLGAGSYRVVGLIRTGMDTIDGVYGFLPLEAARELYALPDGLTGYAAVLAARGSEGAAAGRLQQSLGSPYEVLPWQEMMPAIVQMMDFHIVVAYIILVVVFGVVAVGLANTILMAVTERTREFGVMLALGASPGRIIRMVCWEALFLGVMGIAAGDLLGWAITGYLGRTGLDFSAYIKAMETMPGLSGMVFPILSVPHTLITDGVVLLCAVAVASYPAWKASRLSAVEAIRGLSRVGRARQWTFGLRVPWRPLLLGHRGMFLRLAWRDLFRNQRRSAITLSTIALGLAALIFLYGFAQGFYNQMITHSTGYVTGHLQVSASGYQAEKDPRRSLPEPRTVEDRLQADPRIKAFSPRVQGEGLVSTPQKSLGVMVVGVDPVRERSVTVLHQTIVQGAYLRPGDDRSIVLGDRLAERLGVEMGEKVVVMAQAVDGSLGSGAFRVAGIYDTGSDVLDEAMALMSLNAAQALFGLGEAVSLEAVALQDRAAAAEVAQDLVREISGLGLEVLPWEELLPVVVQMVEVTDINFYAVFVILYGVIALGVINALLMGVMERTREIGVMLAMGTRPGQVVRQVGYEALFLGIGGVAVGLGLGWLLTFYLGEQGLDLSVFARSLETIPGALTRVYPRIVWSHMALPAGLLVLLSVAAALYPAWRAATLDPVRALREG